MSMKRVVLLAVCLVFGTAAQQATQDPATDEPTVPKDAALEPHPPVDPPPEPTPDQDPVPEPTPGESMPANSTPPDAAPQDELAAPVNVDVAQQEPELADDSSMNPEAHGADSSG